MASNAGWPYVALLLVLIPLAIGAKVIYDFGRQVSEDERNRLEQESEFQTSKAEFLSHLVAYYRASQRKDIVEYEKCQTDLKNLVGKLEKEGIVQVLRNGTSSDLKVRFPKDNTAWVVSLEPLAGDK